MGDTVKADGRGSLEDSLSWEGLEKPGVTLREPVAAISGVRRGVDEMDPLVCVG